MWGKGGKMIYLQEETALVCSAHRERERERRRKRKEGRRCSSLECRIRALKKQREENDAKHSKPQIHKLKLFKTKNLFITVCLLTSCLVLSVLLVCFVCCVCCLVFWIICTFFLLNHQHFGTTGFLLCIVL